MRFNTFATYRRAPTTWCALRCAKGVPEQAAGLSSGGFSGRWAQPAWQKDAVTAYLANSAIPPEAIGHYNKSGRAYPDIAAQATDFTVVANRIPNPGVAGTSCASPTASGVIALLNDARLQAGMPVLGFLNPWIYKNAGQWNDITKGKLKVIQLISFD